MTGPEPGRVLRLALVAWGLGHLALGRRATGAALLVLELVAIAALVALSLAFGRGTLDLVPFVAGLVFIGAWATQAIHAYRLARGRYTDDAPASRTPAAAIAWLSLPLLVWSSGYWLAAGEAASPAAVTDRFVADWTADRLADAGWPPAVRRAADRARGRLLALCDDGRLPAGCEIGGSELFRGVRWRVTDDGDHRALAIAEIVSYEQRPTRFLWIFAGSETVPVPIGELLTLDLESEPNESPLPMDAWEWRVRGAWTR